MKDRSARRTVLPGFPVDGVFKTPEELAAYFGGSKVTCLLCGKKYRTLGVHLKTIHEIEPDEYRQRYGIPWTYGLSCSETTDIHSSDLKGRIARGEIDIGNRHESARHAPRRGRQPVQGTLAVRNLAKINCGKTGEEAKRRRNAAKRGTQEHKEKMLARPQMQRAAEFLRTYWVGREQSDEHVVKRTGHHKKTNAVPNSEDGKP